MDEWTVVPVHPSEGQQRVRQVFLVLFNSYREEATSEVIVSKMDDLGHLLAQISISCNSFLAS